MAFDFDGDKYRQASGHQKEWGNAIIAELNLRGDEAILDLGCGDGVLTRRLAGLAPDGEVLGIDASPGMIATAEQKKERNLSFALMDIAGIGFAEQFDVILSNAALHWVKNHPNLLDRCKKALKKGGILKWSFGGFGNCSNLNEVLMASMKMPEYENLFKGFEWPWYMPAEEEYAGLLENAGYGEYEVTLENADRHFADSGELVRWIDQPCIVPFLEYIKDETEKKKFRDTVVTRMIEKTRCSDGTYFETFRRIRVNAVK